MKYTKPMPKLARWLQKLNARIYNRLAACDMQTLVDVCLTGVIFVWFTWLMIFK